MKQKVEIQDHLSHDASSHVSECFLFSSILWLDMGLWLPKGFFQSPCVGEHSVV